MRPGSKNSPETPPSRDSSAERGYTVYGLTGKYVVSLPTNPPTIRAASGCVEIGGYLRGVAENLGGIFFVRHRFINPRRPNCEG